MSGLVGTFRQFGTKSGHLVQSCFTNSPTVIPTCRAVRYTHFSSRKDGIRTSSLFISIIFQQQNLGMVQRMHPKVLRTDCIRLSSSCNYPKDSRSWDSWDIKRVCKWIGSPPCKHPAPWTPWDDVEKVKRVFSRKLFGDIWWLFSRGLVGTLVTGYVTFKLSELYPYIDENFIAPNLTRHALNKRGEDIVPSDENFPISFKATSSIKDIEKEFQASQKKIPVVCLIGQAGSGKSSISREDAYYYEEMMNKHPLLSKAIVTLNAKNEDTLIRSYMTLAKQMKLVCDLPKGEDVFARYKFIFEKTNNALLSRSAFFLIFNDVSDYGKIKRWIPNYLSVFSSFLGNFLGNVRRVLITSESACPGYPSVEARLTLEERRLLFDDTLGSEHPAYKGYSILKTDLIKKSTPILIKLVASYIKTLQQPDEIEQELEDFNPLTEPDQILQMVIQKGIGNGVDPQLMRFLTAIEGDKFSYSVLEKWYEYEKEKTKTDQQKEASAPSPVISRKKELRKHIDKLVNLSILEQGMDGNYRINSSVQEGLMKIYPPPSPSRWDSFYMDVLEFFVEKTTEDLRDVNLKNYKSDSEVAFLDYVDPLYSRMIGPLKAKDTLDTVKVSQLLLRHANFCLQAYRFIDARINFNHLGNLYATHVEDSDSPDKACKKLAEKDPQLPALYAKYLHYSGRLFFFEGSIDKAAKLSERANEIRKIIDDDKGKTYKEIGNPIDPKQNPPVSSSALDSVIFKRQLHGWILLEKKDLRLLDQAKKLYEDLLNEEIVKEDPFNQKYCKLQLAKVHYQLASNSSSKDPQKNYKAAHSYFEEVERLAQSPKAIIPKGPSRFPETSELCFVIAELLLDKKNSEYYDLEKAEKRFKKVEEQIEKERSTILDTTSFKERARLNYYFAQLYFKRYLDKGTVEDLDRAKFRANRSVEEFKRWHFDALFSPTEEYEKAKILAGRIKHRALECEREKYEKERDKYKYEAAFIGN